MTIATAIYLSLVLVMSLACFVAYGLDKRRASDGGRRVPERTLQLLAFLGGWPGALLGQQFLRHKTKTLSFLIAFWAVVVLHVAIVGYVAYAILSRADAVTAPLSTIPAGLIYTQAVSKF